MAIVGEKVKMAFAGGPTVIFGRSDADGGSEAVVTGFNKVLFVVCSYTENPGDVQPCYATESSGTVTFTMTSGKQMDFMIVGV